VGNGQHFMDDLELEHSIKTMDNRELLEFTARQSYDTCVKVGINDNRITKLENKDKKTASLIGGTSGIIGAAVVAVLNWLTTK